MLSRIVKQKSDAHFLLGRQTKLGVGVRVVVARSLKRVARPDCKGVLDRGKRALLIEIKKVRNSRVNNLPTSHLCVVHADSCLMHVKILSKDCDLLRDRCTRTKERTIEHVLSQTRPDSFALQVNKWVSHLKNTHVMFSFVARVVHSHPTAIHYACIPPWIVVVNLQSEVPKPVLSQRYAHVGWERQGTLTRCPDVNHFCPRCADRPTTNF